MFVVRHFFVSSLSVFQSTLPKSKPQRASLLYAGVAVTLAALLSACASKSPAPAPVEDRKPSRVVNTKDSAKANSATPSSTANSGSTTSGTAAAAGSLKGAENAGKPGYYTVKPGDTLYRIGLDNGQAWKDVARWNDLESPYTIEVGQVLRVTPPASASASAPLKSSPSLGSAPTTPAPVLSADDEAPAFVWPSAGPVLTWFDESKNKGLDIGGKAGDPVLAAADGRVVYAGAGLRGYGNLIILKHNGTFLTAYAHNQALLVKEEQSVRKGQKIAEMGNSDSDRVKLHFEVRRQGKPVDPAKYLSAR
jgi:lipoprotein NlpD